MHHPAAAIAWELHRRHRWGWNAIVAYLLILGVARPLAGAPELFSIFEDELTFAFSVTVPLSAAFMYFLAVFSFGLDGDLGARQSMFPTRRFALPMSTAALAGWPMLYGTAAVAALWLGARFLAVWPLAIEVPKFWPALLAASILAWTQALTWMPYPLRGLRVILSVLCLTMLDVVVFTALHFRPPEWVMFALLAPLVPLAYLTARYAVGRARRGDEPDWSRLSPRVPRLSPLVARLSSGAFASPERAQFWFEWRQLGRSLPSMVALVLPFELAMLFFFRDTPVIVLETLLCVLITPPFMAIFVAATIGQANRRGSDDPGLSSLLSTRPLTTASLVAAKLKVTMASTIAAWLLVLVATPIALRLSGTSSLTTEWAARAVEVFGAPRAVAIAIVILLVLTLATWKQLVQSLCIALSGRTWLIKGSVYGALSMLVVLGVLLHSIRVDGELVATIWNGFAWILGTLACVKMFIASLITIRLHEMQLLSGRALVVGALAWNAVVVALYGLLAWIFVPFYLFAFIAILTIPLVRLSATPLALAWNRHR